MVRKVRKHRRVVGQIKAMPKGAFTATAEKAAVVLILKVSTAAWRQEQKAWSVDVDIVQQAKMYGVTHVCLMVEDGTEALTRISSFQQDVASIEVNRPRQPWMAAERRWIVPASVWGVKAPPREVRERMLIKRMRIAGSAT